jgi:hypothetical protein
MFVLKNTVIISKNISKQANGEGGSQYFIKVINISPLKLFDVRLNLKTIKNSYGLAVGGVNIKTDTVALARNEIPCIFEYSVIRHLFYKDTWAARNCRLIEIKENVEKLLDDSTKLEFTLIAGIPFRDFQK